MSKKTDEILIDQFLTTHPLDAVYIIEKLKNDDIVSLLDSLPDQIAGGIVSHLNINIAINCLQMTSIRKAAGIIDNLPPEIVPMLIRRMPKDFRERLLETISEDKSIYLKKTLDQPEETVGAVMDSFVKTFYEDFTVAEALKYLKLHSKENFFYIYILSRDQKLAGVVSISALLNAKSDKSLAAIMNKKVIKILVDVKYISVLNHPGWQDFHVLPVVDINNVFQGLLWYQLLRCLKEKSQKSPLPQNVVAASSALGELYRLGISGLIRGASEIQSKS
jgi:magnesium transporter